eukprot:scaffold22615_cov133-Isochrysis_galbana.AAC.4
MGLTERSVAQDAWGNRDEGPTEHLRSDRRTRTRARILLRLVKEDVRPWKTLTRVALPSVGSSSCAEGGWRGTYIGGGCGAGVGIGMSKSGGYIVHRG